MHLRLFYILICCIFAAAGAAAQKTASIRFEHSLWDFGTIKEDGGEVSHIFRFTNGGNAPLVIENVETSCGCTTTDFSRKPVMPGGGGQITVVYDPFGRPGPFNKTVTVQANNGAIRAVISILGNVAERVRSVEELYPVALDGGLRLEMRSVYFRYVAQGGAKAIVIKYINTSGRNVGLVLRPDAALKFLRIDAPAQIAPGSSGDITFTFDLTGQRTAWDVFAGNVAIEVDGRRQKTSVYAVAYGIDNFGKDPGTDNAPQAKLSRQYFDFGDVNSASRPVPAEFVIENVGSQPLVIRNVQAGKGLSATQLAGTVIAPGKQAALTVALDPSSLPAGLASQSVMIILNDPLRPVREIRVAAFIK